jgi:adenosylhomocysteine nucleosidase
VSDVDGDFVVLAAMPRELRRLVRALGLRPGSVGGLPAWHGDGVVVAAVGVGPSLAGASSARVLDETTPRRVWITGVAGAVGPDQRVGDLVRPAAVVDVRSGAAFTPDAAGPRVGVLATLERIYVADGGTGVADAARLPDGATAVDMETAAIAAVCEEKGVRWDVVRVISDVPGTLTSEVASLLRPDGRADVPSAVRMVLRHPAALVRLARLGFDTARAVRIETRAILAELAAAAPRRPRSEGGDDGSSGNTA